MSLLCATGLTKSFGAVRALRGVSFELEAGEVHALLGENGAGKSTLIKMLMGVHRPDEGSIALGGELLDDLTPGKARALGLACIYQQPALFPDLSVAENIALRLERTRPWQRLDWGAQRKRARQWLERVGADIDPDTEIGELSMPEQQLVEIACALGAEVRVMIMDEPTASLSEREQRRLFAIVRDLRAAGTGVIYISHRLDEIFNLADRVTVLRDGESIGTNRVDEITESALIRMMVGREVAATLLRPHNEPGEPVLSMRGVGCAAAGLHDIDLQVCAGEIVGLAGLVGAGRTELARVLFGITPADAGEIRLRGRIVEVTSPQQAVEEGIAYLPEDRRRHGVIGEMAVAANITLAIHKRLFPGGWLRSAAERQVAGEYVRHLGVKTPDTGTVANSLSGGNQQKVALARWLATHPQLLILDEPTQGVDIGAKSEIHRIVSRLAAEGLAILLISSDLPEILAMSTRLVVMRRGSIVATFGAAADAHEVMAAALGNASNPG